VAPGLVVVRADAFRRMEGSPAGADDAVTGTVTDVRFRGDRFETTLRTEPGDVELLIRDPRRAAQGDRLRYAVDRAAVMPVGASDA